MSESPNTSSFYKVGGALPQDVLSYVRRKSDDDLYKALKAGEFCYVLNSRQMGKTSLMVRTLAKLQADGWAGIIIDFSAKDSQVDKPAQWYDGIINQLNRQFGLLDRPAFRSWLKELDFIAPVERLAEFIETVLLPSSESPIVIFIDEIDSTLGLPFTDDFFALIRACYNKRAENFDYRRLTFALFGVASPSELIDDTKRTPFNIGKGIDLKGFGFEEALPLAAGLAGKAEQPEAALREILHWTLGQPFLTQRLCQLVVDSDVAILSGKEAAQVQRLVKSRLIENWESQDHQEHLKTICKRLLDNEQKARYLLELYRSIRQAGELPAENQPEERELQLSGLVVKRDNQLQVYNPIYVAVFDEEWINNEIKKLRPYLESLVAWVTSGKVDSSRLLRGRALVEAEQWAGKKATLSAEDTEFLAASRAQQQEIEIAPKAWEAESAWKKQAREATETVTRFIQWVAELIRRRNWFMLMVLLGMALATVGHFFREQINSGFLAEAAQGTFWASFWTGVVLLFVGALAVAVMTMPRPASDTASDEAERKAIKGLRPFSRDDAAIFAQLQRVVSLRECYNAVTSDTYKFGILMGKSGCGKTSFLQAGLWPKLSEPNSSHRAIYIRFSNQDSMATVSKALAEQLEVPMDWLGIPFSQMLTQAMEAAGKPIVLLLDQFEQFFIHNPYKEDRATFVQALTTWYQDPGLNRVKILVSIRADLLYELYELHKALQYTLGPEDLFKLDHFTPAEATKILAVIADTERLDFDPRFVTELAERELAHRESGTISPVDLQILAWMIERQQGDDLRAFNRTAFQKLGGVEGLLTRFLERTLDVRVLPNQREAAIKTLLALTDLDRQVRAGVLTVAELQSKLKDTAKPDEIKEAVTWLSRSDVRLITPQDKDGTLGYELAYERLIPGLMRLAGRELTAADKANQLLERRVNEWLGNQRHSRYLLGWRELWLIQRERPYLVWGAKRLQKERLIRQSQRRTYAVLCIVGALLLAGIIL